MVYVYTGYIIPAWTQALIIKLMLAYTCNLHAYLQEISESVVYVHTSPNENLEKSCSTSHGGDLVPRFV